MTLKPLHTAFAVIISGGVIAGAIFGYGKLQGKKETNQQIVVDKLDRVINQQQGQDAHLKAIDSTLIMLLEDVAMKEDVEVIRRNQVILFKYNNKALKELEKLRKEKELENLLKKNLLNSETVTNLR